MAMQENQIRELIQQAIPDAQIEIEDLRGDGDHYSCHIISKIFSNKSRVEQHKIVYSALKGKMGNELHALAIKTSTPE